MRLDRSPRFMDPEKPFRVLAELAADLRVIAHQLRNPTRDRNEAMSKASDAIDAVTAELATAATNIEALTTAGIPEDPAVAASTAALATAATNLTTAVTALQTALTPPAA